MTINKSQRQTLQKVSLDVRDDVFTHGQLYVALSRTTSRENILCLVKTNRLIDNVPHVANVVFREFILAATGREPLYLNVNSSGTGKSNKSNTDTDSDSSSDKDSDSDTISDNSESSSDDNSNKWTIANEIGDGTCLFRCIARKVHGDSTTSFQAESIANLSLPLVNPTRSTSQSVTTSTSCPTHMLTPHILKSPPPIIYSTSTSMSHLLAQIIRAHTPSQTRATFCTTLSPSTTTHSSTTVKCKAP